MAKDVSLADSKVWLITGCSSGLGQLLVQAALSRGDQVIATARNIDSLPEELYDQQHLRKLQLDVTAPQAVLDQKIRHAIAWFGRIDVLVNNAGYVASGVWEHLEQQVWDDQFDTNFWGSLHLAKSILPHMRQRGRGTLVFMSSIAGWVGTAAGGPYSASKFALEGAVECLQKETVHLNIETYLIVLGQFRTGILGPERKRQGGDDTPSQYAKVLKRLGDRQGDTHGKQPGDPKLAAERVVDLVRREGMMSSTEPPPFRLFLGSDCHSIIKKKCENTLAQLNELGDVAYSTDYAEVTELQEYD